VDYALAGYPSTSGDISSLSFAGIFEEFFISLAEPF
jgi:hypothetical protein